MKKINAVISVVLLLCLLCTGCIFRKTAKGRNARIDYTGEATVSFYPVCPDCDHVSPISYINISDGEHGKITHMCEKCYEIYTIIIDRR